MKIEQYVAGGMCGRGACMAVGVCDRGMLPVEVATEVGSMQPTGIHPSV